MKKQEGEKEEEEGQRAFRFGNPGHRLDIRRVDGEQKASQQGDPCGLDGLQNKVEQADAGSVEQQLGQVIAEWLEARKEMDQRQEAVVQRSILAGKRICPDGKEMPVRERLDAIVLDDVVEIIEDKSKVGGRAVENERDAEQQSVREGPPPGLKRFRKLEK